MTDREFFAGLLAVVFGFIAACVVTYAPKQWAEANAVRERTRIEAAAAAAGRPVVAFDRRLGDFWSVNADAARIAEEVTK